MAKRSLQASPPGIQQAKRAFALKGWTQENLAGEVNLKTRQPVWRFFSGHPVDRQVFMELCTVLDLEWRDVAGDPPAVFSALGPAVFQNAPININTLVEEVRVQRRDALQNQCGILQLLDISRPIGIDSIYVDVNVWEEIASQQWVDTNDLHDLVDPVGLGTTPPVSGMQAVQTYPKLRVLGKPGMGKTTFLQHIAIQCNRGTFAAHQVPIFIVLRDFVEESRENLSLFNYIQQMLLAAGPFSVGPLSSAGLEMLLKKGRVLLILDGMDEVLDQDMAAVLREIRKFSDQYYHNRFVVSCRTTAQRQPLRGFTDVEIAPFNPSQIITFAQKWFEAIGKPIKLIAQSDPAPSVQFIHKLNLPENLQFRQLIVTPLFLHLACCMFQGQQEFSAKRTEFYQQGLELMMGKWDEAKGIGRDDSVPGFLLPQKLRLMNQLASVTFERGDYFFEQRFVEQYISDYLQNLSGVVLAREELQLESAAILQSIAAQNGLLTERARGIFSFSYLAFQEYFMACKIVASPNLSALEQALTELVHHITDPHWREVFLLTTGMLGNADGLMQLMKHQIDQLLDQDPDLQDFLLRSCPTFLNPTSQHPISQSHIPQQTPFNPETAQIFHYALAQAPETAAKLALASILNQEMLLDAALDHLLLETAIERSPDFTHTHACRLALSNILVMVLDVGFYQSLRQLSDQLPPSNQSQVQLQDWWQKNYRKWVEQLRNTVDFHRHTAHVCQFNPEQQRVLQCYYDANQLLVDCLNSNCEVTKEIR